MSSFHSDFTFSATIHTDDIDLVAALRGLAWASQSGQKMISSSGTGEKRWKANGHQVKFFFTSRTYRDKFLEKTHRLFATGWTLKDSKDDEAGAPRGDSY